MTTSRVPPPQEPKGNDADSVDSYRMPLLEHLAELRTRLVRALVAAVIGCRRRL